MLIGQKRFRTLKMSFSAIRIGLRTSNDARFCQPEEIRQMQQNVFFASKDIRTFISILKYIMWWEIEGQKSGKT